MNGDDVVVVVVVLVESLNVEGGGVRRASRSAGVLLPPTGVRLAAARATSKHQLVGQVKPAVVLDRQIVGAVAASRPVPTAATATAPHRPVDLSTPSPAACLPFLGYLNVNGKWLKPLTCR